MLDLRAAVKLSMAVLIGAVMLAYTTSMRDNRLRTVRDNINETKESLL